MNLDLNLLDALRDYLNEDHDDHLMGVQDLKANVREWVKERMVGVWEEPDQYTLTTTDLLEELTNHENLSEDQWRIEYVREVKDAVSAIREWLENWSERNATG